MKTLSKRIEYALSTTEPGTRARRKALHAIRWRLRFGLLYAGQTGSVIEPPMLVAQDDPRCIVFSGLDNEELKAKFFGTLLNCKFEVELL